MRHLKYYQLLSEHQPKRGSCFASSFILAQNKNSDPACTERTNILNFFINLGYAYDLIPGADQALESKKHITFREKNKL